MSSGQSYADELTRLWNQESRWQGVQRDYSAHEVLGLRGSLKVEHTFARQGANRLWRLLQDEPFVRTFGAMTGAQAVQMVRAGLQAIYVSGWQVAADANPAGKTYSDQSLYPCNGVPTLVRRINHALARADQIDRLESGTGGRGTQWYAPIIADAEAGFGGPIHAFELAQAMIEAGAAAIHFEDQLASEKKCGHLGGKVLTPTSQFIRTLQAARLSSDVAGVPAVLIARTDALGATLLTSDVDPRDQRFITGVRTPEGYYRVRAGLEAAIARGLSYAPYADLLWFETSRPDLGEAREFAQEIHRAYQGKLLAYNCSPSFNWKKHLDDRAIARFQDELGDLGYRFQFITLAGWHLVNLHSFALAREYANDGMTAYVRTQEEEFRLEPDGYTAARHQREVGTGYFDQILTTLSGGEASTGALVGSTEMEQFTAGCSAGGAYRTPRT